MVHIKKTKTYVNAVHHKSHVETYPRRVGY